MFEPSSIVKYRFVQRNGNKTLEESFLHEYIYCFFLKESMVVQNMWLKLRSMRIAY